VPLIVLTVLIHVLGLGLIRNRVLDASASQIRRHPTGVFVGVIGLTTLVVICLHGSEAIIWLWPIGCSTLYLTSIGDVVFAERHDELWAHQP
jgi:hypothetical protein